MPTFFTISSERIDYQGESVFEKVTSIVNFSVMHYEFNVIFNLFSCSRIRKNSERC